MINPTYSAWTTTTMPGTDEIGVLSSSPFAMRATERSPTRTCAGRFYPCDDLYLVDDMPVAATGGAAADAFELRSSTTV
jgi:hypothetical protein